MKDMSLAWAFFGTDKENVLLGAVFLGFIVVLFIGLPLYLITKEYELNIPVWVGLIFIIIVFSISVFLFYKAGCKKLKK